MVKVLVLVMLVAAALLAVRQINHAAASSATNEVRLIKVGSSHLSASQASEESSAPAGDSSDSGPASSTSHTSLTVNGQAIAVPQNGTVDQTIDNGGSTTTIHADNSSVSSQTADTSQGSARNTSRTTLNVQVNSNSSSQGSGG